ncbi:MAG: response regulator [Pseudonocardiales bacterium]|nr:response regulator [Pseudonocardiales bacterium]
MIRTVVVDDEEDALRINRESVERVPGFVVTGVARSGREALTVLNNQPVDLVLLDFLLPDMSGRDVCYALRDPRRPLVDIIAVTGKNDTDTFRALRAFGVEFFLIKPYRFAYFREKLEAYAEYYYGLLRYKIISQCELDDLIDKLRVARDAALPKGLSSETYELIVGVLHNADRSLSVAEVADAAGLSQCVAGRYLKHLHDHGLVVRTRRYGTTGRPPRFYHWDEPAQED